MNLQFIIYITLVIIWILPLREAYAEDSIINQYDANGSLVSGDGKFYEYNDANQLVRVREKDANGAVVAEYFYDHAGQRVKKVENGVTTYYLGKHYETQVVQGQVKNTSYYFAEGDRVAKKDSTGTYYYHPDHLGGTSAVTNSAKQVVSSTSYLPFGEVRQGGAENYYTGKEKDKAADLYNFEARYVSPELRHFTQADIADPDFDDPQDLNRYAYVGNNPLSFVDLDGYKKKKKSKLSKREKWMIAHGVDPDNDKTPLKKAKKLFKADIKYTSTISFLSVTNTNTFNGEANYNSNGNYNDSDSIKENMLLSKAIKATKRGLIVNSSKYMIGRGFEYISTHSSFNPLTLGKLSGTMQSYSKPTLGFAFNMYDTYNYGIEHPEKDMVEVAARFSIDVTVTAISGVATCLSGPLGLAMSTSYAADKEHIQDSILYNPLSDWAGESLYNSLHGTKAGNWLGL